MKQLFVLRLGNQRYALPLENVERVLRMVEITEIPDARRPILGVINVQGRLLSVIDLRAGLHLPTRKPVPEDVLVVVNVAGKTAALAADGVEGVGAGGAEPEPTGEDLLSLPARLEGVAKLADGLVPILDLNRLLAGDGGKHGDGEGI